MKAKKKKRSPKAKVLRLSALKFDKKGLITAIIQDEKSNDVLMVAYMNKQSLKITLKEGKTCFYSRSRKKLWRKHH